MSIGHFCNRDVICTLRGTRVAEAAELMRRHHVGDVVVVEETAAGRRPIGIVTDRDIVVEVVAAGLDPAQVTAGELTLRPLVTIAEHAGHGETIRAMAAQGVRRMPVVDGNGMLVGIVTEDDLLRHLVMPLAELAELSARERRFESRTRT